MKEREKGGREQKNTLLPITGGGGGGGGGGGRGRGEGGGGGVEGTREREKKSQFLNTREAGDCLQQGLRSLGLNSSSQTTERKQGLEVMKWVDDS